MTRNTNEVLAERQKTHGSFDTFSKDWMELFKNINSKSFESGGCCVGSDPVMWAGMLMITHKITRITNGQSDFEDHWRDISGYAELVANHLLSKQDGKNESAARERLRELNVTLAAEQLQKDLREAE